MTQARSETHSIKCTLNNYAFRVFRDIADQDYITARFCFRAGLVPQYLSSSSQCLEKYFKTIFLLNRIKATKVSHDLGKCLTKLDKLNFKVELESKHLDFIHRLIANTPARYFERSNHVKPYELWDLDSTVWYLRRYCQVLDHTIKTADGEIGALMLNLEALRRAEKNPIAHQIIGGKLEKIIEKTEDPARPVLIWKNLYFGPRNRNTINAGKQWFRTHNSPNQQHVEILPYLRDYIKLDSATEAPAKK
jgi:HEPN domain-containing protein